MRFKEWAIQKNLNEQESNPQEIKDLLGLADQKIADCITIFATNVSRDTCHEFAYSAAIPCAKAVLRASGYDAAKDAKGGHDILINGLGFIPELKGYVDTLHAARYVRQQIMYASVSNVQKDDADKLLRQVRKFRNSVEVWIRKNHPDLLKLI